MYEHARPSEDTGPRLRQARLDHGLSLRALATELDVSSSLISQIETGKTKPSVGTLYALVSRLGLSMDELLGHAAPGAAPRPPVPFAGPVSMVTEHFRAQSAAENPTLEMENGVTWERLAALGGSDVEGLRVTYRPGASSSVEGHLMRHFGVEHVYLLSGELTLRLEFDTHVIRAGDSMAFDSRRPHLFSNESDAAAVGIWYVVGRRSSANEADAHEPTGEDPADAGPPASAVDVLRRFGGR